ncbi:MAG: alpha/beta fold hydrolase [Dehalococcoidia bacterium]|nr:alpha/beta fold hydrolase [Dehalococcoidia bacterium]
MALTTQEFGESRVRVWIAGSGPDLLFLHGYEQHPGDASFLHRLAEHHTVYAPEHPGYGESTGFESLRDIIDLALRYRQLVESWGIESVDVIGHCLGGMIAAEFAATSPHLVRRLVLVDAWGLWRDDQQPADPFVLTEDELAQAKWHDPATAPNPEPSIFQPDPSRPHAAMLTRGQNLGVAGKFMWPIPDRGLRRRLPFVKAQTLVVHGESDGLIPAVYAEEFQQLIPDAEVARLPAAGHLPMIEREDDFIDTVEAFLIR